MGSSLKLRHTTYATPENHTWAKTDKGFLTCHSVTLLGTAFLATFPTGFVPSGVTLGKITATGLYAPYNNADSPVGTTVMRGLLFTSVQLVLDDGGLLTDSSAALLWEGDVIEANLVGRLVAERICRPELHRPDGEGGQMLLLRQGIDQVLPCFEILDELGPQGPRVRGILIQHVPDADILWLMRRCRPDEVGKAFSRAHDDCALPHLRHAEHVRGQFAEVDFVAEGFELFLDLFPRPTAVMADEVRDILDEDVSRFMGVEDFQYVIEQITPLRAVKTELVARL